MKKTGWGKRISGFMAVLVLCLFCLSGRAYAYGMIDTEAEASLTVVYQDSGRGVKEVQFDLYRIADVSETARYSLAGEFADYPVSLEDLDSSGWRDLAQTLAGYAQRDQIVPDRTGNTDENGRLVFTDLTPGLFLVIGETSHQMDSTYIAESFICSLPGLTEEDDWEYDVEAAVKYEKVPDPVLTSREVVKVWKNDDRDSRPSEIEVQLLCDGDVVDTQKLNEENNWSYRWEGLDAEHGWNIAEREVPGGYQVSVSQEGTKIIVTNSGTVPDDPDSSLPQTGALWWPVPLLTAGGLLLFMAGWLWQKRQENRRK